MENKEININEINDQNENNSNNNNNIENGSTQSQNNTQISQEEQKNLENGLNNNININNKEDFSVFNCENIENQNENRIENNTIENNNNGDNQNNNNNNNEQYLNHIKQYSNNIEFYNEYFKNTINRDYENILNYNLQPTDIDNIKIIYKYLCGYIGIRLNYLKYMLIEEITFIAKITYNRHKVYYLNTYYQNDNETLNNSKIIEQKILFPLLQNYFPDIKRLNNSYNKLEKVNSLYKYFLEFLFKENFLFKFYDDALQREDLDIINFSICFFYISYLFIFYDKENIINNNLVFKYIQLIEKRFENFILNDELKDLNRNTIELVLYNKSEIEYNLTFQVYSELKENNFKELKNLFKQDLNLSYKLLQSNNLEKRTIGISLLSNLCSKLLDNNYCNIYEFKKDILLNFLLKIDIYNLIFGENIHEATLTRAPQILVFLYKNNKLTNNHIINLWKFYQEKHQSIGESILKVFSELMTDFSIEHSNFVLKIISDMNYKDINDNTLTILDNFNKVNLRNENLLKILFKFSNENSFYDGLSGNIIMKSREILSKILLKEEYKFDLVKFIKKCVYGIGCNNNINTYLYLLNDLLQKIRRINKKEIYQAFDPKIDDYNTLLIYLDDKLTLTSTILYSLIDIKKQILLLSSEINEIQKILIKNSKNESENIININNYNDENNSINNIQDNNQYMNLDLTQSTEKTFEDNNDVKMDIDNDIDINENDNSFNSISTDISDFEKNKKIIIKNFIESYQKELLSKDFLLKENYNFIFRNLKLNFQGQNYYKFICSLLDFLKNLLKFSSINLTKQQIEFLYIILVKERVDEEEENVFYSFFSELIKEQFCTNFNIISEENLSYLCLELFYRDDSLVNITYKAFDLIKSFFLYINFIHNNIKYDNDFERIISINNFSCLSSFKTIWKIYLLSNNKQIEEQSFSLLNNIILIVSEHLEDKQLIFEDIFQEISIYQKYISKNPDFINVIKKLINLLSILSRFNNQSDNVTIIFKNNYYDKNGEESKHRISKNLPISQLKKSIIENIICSNNDNSEFKRMIHEKGISLKYKDFFLNDNLKISDYYFEDNSKIIILKEEDNINKVLNNDIMTLKTIFTNYDKEMIFEALKKNNRNIEASIQFLNNSDNVKQLKEEIEDKKQNEIYNLMNKNRLILTEEKINILLSLLDINENYISNFIWKLLSEVQFPYSILKIILNENYKEIFNEENRKNKILLLLKLSNSIIFKDDFYKLLNLKNEKRKNWIYDLISNKEIMKIYFNFIEKILDKTESNFGIELNILSILLDWLKIIINNLIRNEKNSQIFSFFDIQKTNFIEFLIEINFENILWNLTNKLIDKINIINDYLEKSFISLFEIIIFYCKINSNVLKYFLLKEYKSNLLIDILIFCNKKYFRREVRKFFEEILNLEPIEINEPEIKGKDSKELLKLHIINNHTKIYNSKDVNNEFFNLFGGIISEIEYEINFKKLTQYIINSIISLSQSEEINEEILLGYLNFFQNLFSSESIKESLKENFENNSNNIINLLLEYLFYINPDYSYKEIKYKNRSEQIRQKYYELLQLIQNLSPIYSKHIIDKVLLLFNNFELTENHLNEIEIPFREKEDTFIGLKNYGATCYLNSLFQQFFMNPSFNKMLYKFNIQKENNENSIILNMQIAFENLRNTWKKYYPLINFIKSFKEAFNSEPINVKTQQDSDEFLAILCDEIEKEGKKYNMENCLEESFKGKISNEIISLEKEYPYYSCRDEPFFKLTLDIKGHKSLEEALDFYIKEEILEGENKYFVDKYNKKISISKRCSIKKMSNTVIIHLKRFEFDYYTFTNNKLNDYLKFPLEINFQKWTKAYLNMKKDNNLISEEEREYLIDNKLNYQLTGILIHSGSTLAHGHYYSFIMDQQNGKWFKFDDTKISCFDINNIEYESFGGNIENNYYSQFNSQNAYLLFYTRKDSISFNKFNNQFFVSQYIQNLVKKENEDFWKVKIFLSDNFFFFFQKIIDYESKVGFYKEIEERYNNFKKMIQIEKDNNLYNASNKEIYDKWQEEIQIRNEKNKENKNLISEKIQRLKNIPQMTQDIFSKFMLYYYICEKNN